MLHDDDLTFIMQKLIITLLIGWLLLFFQVQAQQLLSPVAHITTNRWQAKWITARENPYQYGVYHFRKKFSLTLNLRNSSFMFLLIIATGFLSMAITLLMARKSVTHIIGDSSHWILQIF